MTGFIAPLLISCALVLPAVEARAQAPRDPRAVSLLNAAMTALSSGADIRDVTLTGTVTRTAGSQIETGTATLQAVGGVAGRIQMTLTDGPRSEVINQSQGALAGQWSGPDGSQHAMAQHNALVPAAWFFPALVLAAALNDPSVQLAYVGQEMKGAVAVEHIQFWRVIPSRLSPDAAVKLFAHLTTADVYLTAANSLPVALDFNVHPDSNEKLDISVEIQYGGYQKINGILLPAHVQKFINNALLLDLNMASATVNSGLPASDFSVTAQDAGLKAPPGAVAPVSSPAAGRSGRTAGGDTRATKAAGGGA